MFKENIDECVSNPCVNGNCTDQVNNFTCSCEAGYSGDTCNGEVNMCNCNFTMTAKSNLRSNFQKMFRKKITYITLKFIIFLNGFGRTEIENKFYLSKKYKKFV